MYLPKNPLSECKLALGSKIPQGIKGQSTSTEKELASCPTDTKLVDGPAQHSSVTLVVTFDNPTKEGASAIHDIIARADEQATKLSIEIIG